MIGKFRARNNRADPMRRKKKGSDKLPLGWFGSI